jgi:hypothetical protein
VDKDAIIADNDLLFYYEHDYPITYKKDFGYQTSKIKKTLNLEKF